MFTKVTTAVVKEHARNVQLCGYFLSFSPPYTQNNEVNVNQLARVLCTHYLDDSNTGAYNTTIKCSWVDNIDTACSLLKEWC